MSTGKHQLPQTLRQAFPGYRTWTKDEFDALWAGCVFVLDTNILLDLYRWSSEAVDLWFEVLSPSAFGARVWCPHRVAEEYMRNRVSSVIVERSENQKSAARIVDSLNAAKNQMINWCRRHNINADQWTDSLESIVNGVRTEEDRIANRLAALRQEDTILPRLDELFSGKIGPPYSDTEIKTICEDGAKRLQQSIPPGYIDYREAQKKTEEQDASYHKGFGDYLIWRQMMDFASQNGKSFILICRDEKEDWWQIRGGQTLGPRPELTKEMRECGGVDFYMYTPASFLQHASNYLELPANPSIISEVEDSIPEVQTEPSSPTDDLARRITGYMLKARESYAMSRGMDGFSRAVHVWMCIYNLASLLFCERNLREPNGTEVHDFIEQSSPEIVNTYTAARSIISRAIRDENISKMDLDLLDGHLSIWLNWGRWRSIVAGV